MGYGYRRKTCGYCRKDHAILDCEKLQTDAAEAEQKLKEWNTKYKLLAEKAILYSEAYKYEREKDAEGNSYYVYYKRDKERIQRQVNYRFHTEYEWDYDSMPDQLTNGDFCEIEKHRYTTERSIRRTIEKNKEVRAKASARAKKACSYCRQSGHTVRTCSQVKKDEMLHRKVHMISSYKYAKALSRFGVWTGAMVTGKSTMPKMATVAHLPTNPLLVPSNVETSYSRQPDGEYRRSSAKEVCKKAGISVEDLYDFLYLKSAFEGGLRFHSVGEQEGYYSGSNYRISGMAEVCFKTDTVKPEQIDEGGMLYKSSATLDHIYSRISARYNKPNQKERYGSNEINICRHIDDGYSSRYDLYEKKKRKEETWNKMANFVKENKDILNKIKKLNV